MPDILSNGGIGSLGMGQEQQQQNPMPGGNSGGDIVSQLIAQLAKAQQGSLQQRAVIPQPLPPQHVQAGDVSGNFVNPSTKGGPARNARVSLAQSIGNVAAQAINRHEDKEAHDLAFQIQSIDMNINTINDPNASPQAKEMATRQLNEITSAEWKKIQKATGVKFMEEDKRTDVEKKAMTIAQQGGQAQGGGQQQQPQKIGGQPPMSETLDMPQGLNPMAQQFMNKLPMQTGMSPAGIATAELVKSGALPNAGEILRYASDQQYYEAMKQKMGEEAASKAAETARKTQEDFQKMYVQMSKLQDQNEIAAKKLEMQSVIHAGVTAIQEQRIALMKDQLDEKAKTDSEKIDATSKKNEIDKLSKTSKTLDSQSQSLQKAKAAAQKVASKGIFPSAASNKAKEDIVSIDAQIQSIQAQQKKINEKLSGLSDTSDSSYVDPEFQKYADALDKKYLTPAAK